MLARAHRVRRTRRLLLGCSDCEHGLGELGEFTPDQQQAISDFAQKYDTARPPLSFVDWLKANGQGALADAFVAYLQLTGNTAVITTINTAPPPEAIPPEQRIASFDAPTTGGPWALDANGNWFEVKKTAPGFVIVNDQGRAIYQPPPHPSEVGFFQAGVGNEDYLAHGTSHLQRWTDQKFRAANKAMLGPAPFMDLFFNVAPRGGVGEGIGAGAEWNATPELDYDFEGGNLYPGLEGGTQATALWDWYYKNNFDPKYGYDRGLTLNWLRVFTDSDGYRQYKAWNQAEASEFSRKWHLADFGYGCQQTQIDRESSLGPQSQRQADITKVKGGKNGQYSVDWPWPIGPLSMCTKTAASKRRKIIKKAAIIAAVVVGAVFLGPMIAAALKAAGGAMLGAVGAAARGGAAAGAGGIAGTIANTIPTVVGVANAAGTVSAIKNGQAPPPPISVTGGNFADYATSLGTSLLNQEAAKAGEQLTAQQQAQHELELRNEIARLQAQAVAYMPVPPAQMPMYPVGVAAPTVGLMTAQKASDDQRNQLLLYGGAALGALLLFSTL